MRRHKLLPPTKSKERPFSWAGMVHRSWIGSSHSCAMAQVLLATFVSRQIIFIILQLLYSSGHSSRPRTVVYDSFIIQEADA